MAAHVLTGLFDLLSGRFNLKQLEAALAFDTWTEDLEYEDYHELYQLAQAGDREGVIAFVRTVIPFYSAQYDFLGSPHSREVWRDLRWGDSRPCIHRITTEFGTDALCRSLDTYRKVRLCRDCSAKFEAILPQGWRYFPGDTDEAGQFIYTAEILQEERYEIGHLLAPNYALSLSGSVR